MLDIQPQFTLGDFIPFLMFCTCIPMNGMKYKQLGIWNYFNRRTYKVV